MEKKTIQEIARVLVGKNGLQARDAERFAAMMFSVIRDGLERDGLVKVRGLGTFKIVDVEARESVSVKTGERVLIQGHQKVTFTPDATMKELVNKPFSQFETVVLNEGVDFDDMKEEPKAPQEEVEVSQNTEELQEEPQDVQEEVNAAQEEVEDSKNEAEEPQNDAEELQEFVATPVPLMAAQEVAPEPEQPKESRATEEPTPLEESESAEESAPVEEPVSIEQPEEPVSTAESEPQEESAEQPPVPEPVFIYKYSKYHEEPRSRWPWALLTLVLMAASAAGGYYFGTWQVQQNTVVTEVAEVVGEPEYPDDTVVMDSVETAVDSSALRQSQPEASKPVEEKQEEAKPAEVKAKPEQPAPVNDAEDKYANADPRLRYGAYRIVGEDYTIKVRAGETTSRIAKRTLGPDMECYIEAFNGIKSNTELKEGQVIKVPKLELKKKKRQ